MRWRARDRRAAPPPELLARRAAQPLPDAFELSDLPFICYRLNNARMSHLSCGDSPFGGRTWTFQHTFSRGDATSTTSHAIVEVPKVWPHLSVELPSGLAAHFGPSPDQDVPMDFDRPFQQTYHVRSADQRFATSFLCPDVRSWVLEHPGLAFFELHVGLLSVTFLLSLNEQLLHKLAAWSFALLDLTPHEIWPEGIRELQA